MTTDKNKVKISNRPRPLSDLVSGLTRDVFGKKNLLFGKMLSAWPHIAGPGLAEKTMPLDLKFSKKTGNNQATLHLAVQSAFALEFSYQKTLLIERLNVFFGYPAIKDIKIIQDSSLMDNKRAKKAKTRPLTIQEEKKIEVLIAEIQESDLQTALKNLGKAIMSRQDKNH